MLLFTSASLTFKLPDTFWNSVALLPLASVWAWTETSLSTSKNISAFTHNTLNIFLIVGSKPTISVDSFCNVSTTSLSNVFLFSSNFVFLVSNS